MSKEQYARTELLIGTEGLEILRRSRVALFGLGGVGGGVLEGLARAGVGHLELIDADTVSESNLNRQLLATRETVGMEKTEAARQRVHLIDPDTEVTVRRCFYLPENASEFDFGSYDYVVDAVDTVTAKIDIILRAREAGVPVISCMGTGNKLDPSQLKAADISQTSVCPLARVMRKELKKRGVEHLKVVYSTEKPLEPDAELLRRAMEAEHSVRRSLPGSISFVPPAAGLLIAAEVVKDLLERETAKTEPFVNSDGSVRQNV